MSEKAPLHDKIAQLEDDVLMIQSRRAETIRKFEREMSELDEELKEKNDQIKAIEEQIKTPENHHEPYNHLVLPGPAALHWVEGQKFSTIINVVIVTNIIVLFNEIGNKKAKQKYFCLDNGFLLFYCVELLLKWMLWRRKFLIGKFGDVWQHWLDFIIVVSGVLEMWIYPSLLAVGASQQLGDTTWLRLLRLVRLARVVKFLHTILSQDLLWVEGPRFQVFIQGLIMVNSLVIALECDIPKFPWIFLEHLMLGVFSFEVAARLKHHGCCLFFCKNVDDLAWNWLDFIIVFGGIIDQWLMPVISLVQVMIGMEPIEPSKLGQVMMLLRMARLLRILRLIRLIHSIPPLYKLITTIVLAMKGMLWVLVLSFFILYIFALLAVRLVSHGLVFGGTAPADVVEIFPNVPQSIFVLFRAMNGDVDMLEPLFRALPCSDFIFMVFTVISSWSILSILTAVISEKMMKVAMEYEAEEIERAEDMKVEHTEAKLLTFFEEVQKDEKLALEDWREVMTNKEKVDHLQHATGLEVNDIKDLFSYRSRADNVDKHGLPVIKVQRGAFIKGCKRMKQNVTQASIMRLEKQLWEVRQSIRGKIDKIAVSKQSFDIHYDTQWPDRMKEGLLNLRISFDGDMPSLTDEHRYLEEAHDSHGKIMYRRVNNRLEINNLFKVGYSVELCLDKADKSDLLKCDGYYQPLGVRNGRPRYRNTCGAFIVFVENEWQIKVTADAAPAFVREERSEDQPGLPPTGRWDPLFHALLSESVVAAYARVNKAAQGKTAPEERDFPLTFTIVSKKADNDQNIDPLRSTTNCWSLAGSER